MTAKILHKYIYEQESNVKEYHGNKTISQIISELDYHSDLCFVGYMDNGIVVPIKKDMFNYVKPKAGEFLIVQSPAGDNALSTILSIGLMFAAPYLGAWASGAAVGSKIAAVYGAGIALAGSFLIQALVPYEQPTISGGKSESATLSISGTQNRISVGSPVPYHIGTNKFVPPLAAQPVTDTSGKDVYYRQVFIVGYAPCRIYDIKIGDTPIEEFEGIELKVNDGYNNFQDIDTIQGDITSQENMNLVLGYNEPQVVVGGSNAESASLVFSMPRGIVKINHNGNYIPHSVSIKVEHKLTTETEWKPVDTAIKVKVRAYKNLTTQTWSKRVGDSIESYSARVPNSYFDFVDGVPVEYVVGAYIRVFSSQKNNGTYKIYSIDGNRVYTCKYISNGRYDGKALEDEYLHDIEINTGSGNPDAGEITFYDATAQTTYRTVHVPALVKGEYEFRVTRTSTESTSNKVYDEINWVDLQTVQTTDDNGDNLVSFPEQFAYIGLKIKATDQLNGTINQLNCMVDSIPFRYDINTNTFIRDPSVSGNPAWEYINVICGDAAKKNAPVSSILFDDFISWADRCDEIVSGKPRHRMNHVVDYKTNVNELTTKIASVGRASRTMIDGKYTIIQDIPNKQSVQKFTPINSYGFSASKSFVARPDAFKCSWVNPDKDWSTDYTLVKFDDNKLDSELSVIEDLDCIGITNVDEVYRYGKFAHAQVELRPETYKLSVGIEGLIAVRGDVVTVSHDKIQGNVHFGRVIAFTNNSITLDSDLSNKISSGYYVTFRNNTQIQDSSVYAITGVSGTQLTISFGGTAPVDLELGDVALIGQSSESITNQYIIKEINNKDNMEAELTLVDYSSPQIYSSENGLIPNYNPDYYKPAIDKYSKPIKPTVISYYTDERALKVSADGSLLPRIAIDLKQVSTKAQKYAKNLLVGYRLTGSDGYFTYEPQTEVNSGTVYCNSVNEDLSYDIRLRYVTDLGVMSDITEISGVYVSGKTNPPSDVSGFLATLDNGLWSLSWDNVEDLDLSGYIIYNISNTELLRTSSTQLLLNNVVNGSNTYKIKAVDTTGNISVNYTTVTFDASIPAPVNLSALSGTDQLVINSDGTIDSRVLLSWDNVSTASYYQIRYKKSTETTYKYTTSQDNTVYLSNLKDGASYDIGVRSVGYTDTFKSSYSLLNHTVIGKREPPTDVTGLTYAKNHGVYNLQWNSVQDLDIQGYIIYKDFIEVARTSANSFTLSSLVNGNNVYSVKSVDTTGNLSVNYATIDVDVSITAPTFNTIESGTNQLILNKDGTINSRVYLDWDAVPDTVGYEVRYRLASSSVYNTFNTTEHSTFLENMRDGEIYEISVRSLGTLSGLTSTWTQQNHTIIGKTEKPSNVSSGDIKIEDRSIILTWDAIPDLDAKEYEIRKSIDGSWNTATYVTTTNSTSWIRPADSVGTQTWLVKAIDTTGNMSASPLALSINIEAPTQPTVSAQVIDNNVLLKFEATQGTLPVDFYEISRGGEVVGTTSGNFSVIFEKDRGLYTYDVTAIDIAGNRGIAGDTTVNVASPPDYILNVEFNSDFSGVKTNTLLSGNKLFMLVDGGETWGDYLSSTTTYTTIASEVSAGYTNWLTPTNGATAIYQEVYDYGTVLASSLISIISTIFRKTGNPNIVPRIEVSANGTSWTVYDGLWSAYATAFRYVRFTITVTPNLDSDQVIFSNFKIKLDSKIRNDAVGGVSLASDAGGTSFNFNVPFVDVVSIVVTPKLGSGAVYAIYDFVDVPNPTSFKVLLYDVNGNRVTGEFSAAIRGY